MRPVVLEYLRTQWREFHQTLVDDIVGERRTDYVLQIDVKIKGDTRSDVKKIGAPYHLNDSKFECVIEYDAKVTYLHHGHKIPRSLVRIHPNLIQIVYTTVR